MVCAARGRQQPPLRVAPRTGKLHIVAVTVESREILHIDDLLHASPLSPLSPQSVRGGDGGRRSARGGGGGGRWEGRASAHAIAAASIWRGTKVPGGGAEVGMEEGMVWIGIKERIFCEDIPILYTLYGYNAILRNKIYYPYKQKFLFSCSISLKGRGFLR